MKNNRVDYQFSALLHDIGKFGQRTHQKSDLTEEELQLTPIVNHLYHSHLHAGYTSRFFQKELHMFNHLESMSSGHHISDNRELSKKIRLADQIASAVDRSDEHSDIEQKNKRGQFIISRLHSVFYGIDFGKARSDGIFPLSTIDELDFPDEKYVEKPLLESTKEYAELYERFIDEVKKVDWHVEEEGHISRYQLNKMYALLYKFTTTIPASTYEGNRTFVSLFDHLKLTAAVAGCLCDYSEEEIKEPKFVMYEFDVSGIQKFIYKVVEGKDTKPKLAKALRGRSAFINLFTNSITYAILNEFDLGPCNVIFNSGGGGTLLLPNSKDIEKRLKMIEDRIKKSIFDFFEEDISFVSAHTIMDKKELELFKVRKAVELKVKIEDKKTKKYNAFITNQDFFFHPAKSQAVCSMCGKLLDNKETLDGKCTICNTIETVSNFYTKNDSFSIIYNYKPEQKKYPSQSKRVELGYCDIVLCPLKDFKTMEDDWYVESINHEAIGTVKYIANLVPKGMHGDILSFEDISKNWYPMI